MSNSILLSILSLASVTTAQQCDLQFDARVPENFVATTFDTDNDIFSTSFPRGENLKPSDVLELSTSNQSLFDVDTQQVEVTITDASIFVPNPDLRQTGFRRAELIAASNDGSDNSTVGVKTMHFSLMKDETRPLNTSHEYQLFFLEDASFSTNQVVLKTGTILGGGGAADPDTLQMFGNVNDDTPGMIFDTPFTEGVFHNFAVTLDFDQLTTQVFYSTDSNPLEQVTDVISNDVSGQGQYHFGILKKGIDGGDNIVVDGIQPSGIDEGVVFGGIFEEDSSQGCISLAPAAATGACARAKA